MTFGRDPFEELLAGAMRARPEVTARTNLASLAMERARAEEARVAGLARVGRWMRLCSLAAGVLVAFVLLAGVAAYRTSGTATGETGETSVASGEFVDSGTGGTLASMEPSTWGLVLLGVAVVGVAGRMVLVPERSGMRVAAG
jgi:hypothetical protein